MSLTLVKEITGAAGASQTWQARVVALVASGAVVPGEGIAITPSDVTSISCQVFDLSSSTPAVAASTPSITSAAISSSLIADEFWIEDSIGCNFRHTVDGSNFPIAGHQYRTVYTIQVGSESTIFWFDCTTVGPTP